MKAGELTLSADYAFVWVNLSCFRLLAHSWWFVGGAYLTLLIMYEL